MWLVINNHKFQSISFWKRHAIYAIDSKHLTKSSKSQLYHMILALTILIYPVCNHPTLAQNPSINIFPHLLQVSFLLLFDFFLFFSSFWKLSLCSGITHIREDSSEIVFLLVENFNLTASEWLRIFFFTVRGIFGHPFIFFFFFKCLHSLFAHI